LNISCFESIYDIQIQQNYLFTVCAVCSLNLFQDDEDDDFEHLNDEDEFEGFDKERTQKKSHEQPPDLKITKVLVTQLFYYIWLCASMWYIMKRRPDRNKNLYVIYVCVYIFKLHFVGF